jgi:hypothetical protein
MQKMRGDKRVTHPKQEPDRVYRMYNYEIIWFLPNAIVLAVFGLGTI